MESESISNPSVSRSGHSGLCYEMLRYTWFYFLFSFRETPKEVHKSVAASGDADSTDQGSADKPHPPPVPPAPVASFPQKTVVVMPKKGTTIYTE